MALLTDPCFDLPVRIHWKPGRRPVPGLAGSVLRGRPLAVVLEVQGTTQLAVLGLPWENTAVTAVINGWERDGGFTAGEGACRWEFPVDGPGQAERVAALSFLGILPSRCSLRWIPGRGEMKMVPGMIRTAARLGCGLTLPNRPADVITTQGIGAFPDPGELDERTVDAIREMCGLLPPGALRVHDFLLAQAIGGKGAEPDGCEAGNSIAFIEEDGMVYPCESLLLAMGSLREMEMEDIWASPVRRKILERIRSVPEPCRSCSNLDSCRGGCRGAAYHLAGHFGLPDPRCPVNEEDRRG